jgi:hypothetical protein
MHDHNAREIVGLIEQCVRAKPVIQGGLAAIEA